MNIAIDVLAICGPDSKNRGIGNYATSQLKYLFEVDKKNRYFLINFYEDTHLKDLLNYSENVSEHYFYLGKEGFLGNDQNFKEILKGLVRNFITAHQIDVYYMTSPFDRNISYDMEWFKDVKTIATLYDIIPYVFKNRYLGDKVTYEKYMGWVNNLKKTDKILAISQSAKDDLIKHFKVEEKKIEVIYAGTDACYTNINMSFSEKDEFKKKYNIRDQFIMCTGGDDDRKNIADLIIAYSKLPERLIETYQLVIACKLTQASVTRYYEIASKCKVRKQVILTNFVPLEDLIKLYNLAHIVAFPSQYEGFGLPVVESMACGTPVLTSNNSSLGEIAEGAAVLVNPFDVNDISRGLVEILEESNLDELIEKGYERIKLFTWEKVAQSTLDVLNSLEISNNKNNRKNKIAFFTPLPPLQSGISDYSVELLNKISNYFSVDIYIDKGYKPNCTLSENIKIYEHGRFVSKRNEYDEIVYQMGNSEFHTYMIDYLKKYSGILVLHDYNLHGLLYHMSKGDSKKYKEYLYEDYNKDFVDQYVNDFNAGKTSLKVYEIPCNGIVTNYAKKIIVHSDYSKKLLLHKDISRNVRKILLFAEIKELYDKERIRKKLNIVDNKLVLAAFGHIHETKRIMPVLNAFKKLSDKYNNINLYLVGKPSSNIKEELESFIQMNNLSTKVIITGYTELNIFEEYIDASDICLNLRYPYNGESSASLMRILSKGKCVLINDLGSFAEIPNDCSVKLESPEFLVESEEIDNIMEKLEELISYPELINSIGAKARKFAEEHLDIEDIAKQYSSFINESVDSSITESMLLDISEYIKQNREVDIEEIYRLSMTLAFSKWFKEG